MMAENGSDFFKQLEMSNATSYQQAKNQLEIALTGKMESLFLALILNMLILNTLIWC